LRFWILIKSRKKISPLLGKHAPQPLDEGELCSKWRRFAVCGAPDALGAEDAATRMALFALAVRDLVARETARFGVQLRIGLGGGGRAGRAGAAVHADRRHGQHGVAHGVARRTGQSALLGGDCRFAARAPIEIKGRHDADVLALGGARQQREGDEETNLQIKKL
jgi:hypothetical protein